MHQSRIERAQDAVDATPEPDVASVVAALADTLSAASGSAVPHIGSGCFNPGVARMLTHWKES